MRKPMFDSVKEYRDFVFQMFGLLLALDEIQKAQELGYIRRSPVEEAEEIFHDYEELEMSDFTEKWENIPGYCAEDKVMNKLYDAIQYLKKQLEEK